ncbi:uncharacterized protein LOC143238950 [Tachypleus tridentatus]|uniref:uncharacterized protein LOC143238950 n=1 Tax=Tachypleus tridentatus TaxID=6853 RepID=UPI003FD1C3E8
MLSFLTDVSHHHSLPTLGQLFYQRIVGLTAHYNDHTAERANMFGMMRILVKTPLEWDKMFDKMNSKPAQYCSNRPKGLLEWTDSRLLHYISKMAGSNCEFVLDFGCGPEDVTKNILLSHCPNLRKMFAVDIQSDFIDFAMEKFDDERIEYMVLDITQKTPSQWAKIFDKVFAILSFTLSKVLENF